ncbi:MAG: YqgE/AlgH family protein [Gammaproteobacteria bacterium]|nr:MAG: YqgE/AlgH family protein [Gammaproteobacteria bacterium]
MGTLNEYLSHRFLLAMPGLHGSFFGGSLIYLIDHDADGAMGLVINHPSSLALGDVIDQIGVSECTPDAAALPILVGGPVDIQRGFVLHTPGKSWPSTVIVDETLALSTCRDILADIAAGQGPEKSLIVLGYSGWGPGQLEAEMAENSWLTLPADTRILFDVPLEQRAQQAVLPLGIRLDQLSAESGHA